MVLKLIVRRYSEAFGQRDIQMIYLAPYNMPLYFINKNSLRALVLLKANNFSLQLLPLTP